MIDDLVRNYPWAAFLVVWLLWTGGTLWEYRLHRNKQVTGAWLLFLFCILAFALSTIEALGIARWFLTGAVLIFGWLVLKRVLRDGAVNKQNAV